MRAPAAHRMNAGASETFRTVLSLQPRSLLPALREGGLPHCEGACTREGQAPRPPRRGLRYAACSKLGRRRSVRGSRTPTRCLREESGGATDAIATSPPIIVRDSLRSALRRFRVRCGGAAGCRPARAARGRLHRQTRRHPVDLRLEGAGPAGPAGPGGGPPGVLVRPDGTFSFPLGRADGCPRQDRAGAAADAHREAAQVHLRSGRDGLRPGDQGKQGLRDWPGEQAWRLRRQPARSM